MSNGGYQGFRMSDRWIDGWMDGWMVVVVVLHVRNEVPLLRTLFSISHWLLFTISFTTQSPLLMTFGKMLFENIVEKGENTVDQHFPFFVQCFLPFPQQISLFPTCSFCCLQMLLNWSGQNCCCLVKTYSSQKYQCRKNVINNRKEIYRGCESNQRLPNFKPG